MKSNNYICHVPYFRNSIAYDHDFWYTSVKMIISQNVFFIFSKFWFFGLLGVKMAKHGPKWQKVLSVALHISGTIHRVTVIYGTHLWNDNIWRCFFILSKFCFSGSIWRWNGKKQSRMTKSSVCCVPYLRNHTSYDCHLLCKYVKW